MDSSSEVKSELSRDLSLYHVIMLGVGMMIGAGVFVLTGIGIGISGPGGILIAFALNGVVALLCTMAYAELASAMPEAGGGYAFVREGIGGITGFLSGWMSWFGHAVAGSLYAITFSTYTLHFLEETEFIGAGISQNELLVEGLAVAVALVFIYINYKGASETGTAGTAIAVGQMGVLGFIGLTGLIVALQDPSKLTNFSPFLPEGWGMVLVTMGFTYIGFEGYEVIAQAGEEVENPRRNIPKAIFYSLTAVVTIYLFVAFSAIIGAKPEGISICQWFGQHGARGLAESIGQLVPFGGVLITFAAIFASTSALNATTYSSTRVSFALGRDRYLPEALSRISEKRRIPDMALLLSGAIMVLIVLALPVEGVAASAGIMFLLLFLLVNVSVIKIRQERGRELDYGYLIPLFPLIPILAIVSHLILAIWVFSMPEMGPIAWSTAALWILVGFGIWMFYSKSRGPPEKGPRVLEERRALKGRPYQILVPVSNPENARSIMKFVSVIARARNAEILILSVVVVPEQTPLSEASKFVGEKRRAIDKAMKEAPDDVPVHSTIRYAHDVPRAVISAVKEHESNLLILGCDRELEKKGSSLGSVVDPVVERSICDLIVVKPGRVEGLKKGSKILCPTARGPHSSEAVRVAIMFAEDCEGEITLFHLLREGEDRGKMRKYMELLIPSSADFSKLDIKIDELRDDKLTETIVDEAKDYDQVIIGATKEGWFERLIFGALPEKVAAQSDRTVILVKKYQGMRSWIRRWLGS